MTKPELVIFLVEDNLGDIRLTQEALRDLNFSHELIVRQDGVSAWEYLVDCKKSVLSFPDFIIMDLNLPRKNGRELLAELKKDPELKSIPVMVLSTSQDEREIQAVYDLHANAYVGKPVNYDDFLELMKVVRDYWFHFVQLPKRSGSS